MVGLIVMVAFLGTGLLLYPNHLALSYGDILTIVLRRIAWFEMWFFAFQLNSIFQRWIAVMMPINTGRGFVSWSFPPYPEYGRYTLGVLLSLPLFLLYSLNFFGTIEPVSKSLVWLFFILSSLSAFFVTSRALDIMMQINKIIWQDYLDAGWSPSIPVLISATVTLGFLLAFYGIFSISIQP